MSRTVLTYGTFDLFHVGHLNLLRRARALGDRLIVGVSTDEFNASKGKQSIISFPDRLRIVQSVRYVDEAFAESSWQQKAGDIQQFHVETLVMGDDWNGQFDFLRDRCDVVYLPRTRDISSSRLRSLLTAVGRSRMVELKAALDTISAIVGRFE